MNYKYMNKTELIDLICIRFKYTDEVVKQWERRYKTIDFKALEEGMKSITKPKAYYDVLKSFKYHTRGKLISFLIAINKGRQ